jgi:beta-mannanase
VGFFVGGESPSATTSLGSALGVEAKVLTVYAYNAGAGPYTAFTVAPGAGYQLLLGVGAVSPAQATSIGDNLVAEGYSNTIIRIMWEMNGNWEPWGTQALSATQYMSIYRAAEQAFAAVPGNHFTYIWNVSAGTVEPGRTEFDTYPGNAYVSNVGIDLYNEWSQYKNVSAIIAFARSQDKPVSFDEWGLSGSDNPAFIDYVSGVVHNPANDVTLQAYFSYGSSDISQFPAAEAEYTKDFSGSC